MEPVASVRELQQKLSAGENCKIKLAASDKLQAAIREANVSDKLDVGIQLIPRDVTKVMLAAICEIGTTVAKAPFDGYALGLKRKGGEYYLYFTRHEPGAAKARPGAEM